MTKRQEAVLFFKEMKRKMNSVHPETAEQWPTEKQFIAAYLAGQVRGNTYMRVWMPEYSFVSRYPDTRLRK